MKNLFSWFVIIVCISFIVSSCSSSSDSKTATTTTDNTTTTTTDTTSPVIAEVTAVTTPDNDTTPNYTFSSTEAGTITYGGSCSSSTTSATTGNNTVTFNALVGGTYDNCTITVTDNSSNVSNTLSITSFVIDTTAPVIAEVTAVTTPTSSSSPNYTFSSTEAGTITYGGSCSSSTTSATTNNNTITFSTLDNGTYSDCTITVTDNLSNVSDNLSITSFSIVQSQIGGSIQSGEELSLSTELTLFAGGAPDVTFSQSNGITSDGTNLYVTTYYNKIHKISISTGVVTTLAGTGSAGSANGTGTSASFNVPRGITSDGTNLYVADYSNNLIRKIVISTGVVTTLAGSGSAGYANGTGTSAIFNLPRGITTDGTNLYVTEYGNHLIRKIVISTGVVTKFAGYTFSGNSGSYSIGYVDSDNSSLSKFWWPLGITNDGTNLYVTENSGSRIRKIVIDNGTVTTLSGTGSSGSANGTGTSASFYSPEGMITDGTNLYVADTFNHLIRKIVISTGVVTTVAGTGSQGFVSGTGTSASLTLPVSITTDGTNLYVGDYLSIRKIE